MYVTFPRLCGQLLPLLNTQFVKFTGHFIVKGDHKTEKRYPISLKMTGYCGGNIILAIFCCFLFVYFEHV